MNKTIHRWVTALLAGLAAVSGLLTATDPSGLDVSAQTWGWIMLLLGIAQIAVTVVRTATDTEA